MTKKKATQPNTIIGQPIQLTPIKNRIEVKCLRIKIDGVSGYSANKKYDINIDEMNGESESVNSFLIEVRTLCDNLK
jgi:hypothetical protein